MTFPPEYFRCYDLKGEPFYIDGFNRVYDKNKKQVKCKHIDEKGRECRTHLEYASTIGIHCSDNLLHRQ